MKSTHDEPPKPTEGANVEREILGEDGLDDEERARLHEAIRESIAQADIGDLIDADEFLRELRSRT